MNHQEWADHIKEAFSLRDSQKYGDVYRQSGNLEQSAKFDSKRAELNKAHALSHGRSAANSLAYAALCYFELGQTTKAVRIAREALHLFGYYIDPSSTLEKISELLRNHYQKEAEAKMKMRRKRKRK
jgi:hypothetical protein